MPGQRGRRQAAPRGGGAGVPDGQVGRDQTELLRRDAQVMVGTGTTTVHVVLLEQLRQPPGLRQVRIVTVVAVQLHEMVDAAGQAVA